jgi:hypothetical protein
MFVKTIDFSSQRYPNYETDPLNMKDQRSIPMKTNGNHPEISRVINRTSGSPKLKIICMAPVFYSSVAVSFTATAF